MSTRRQGGFAILTVVLLSAAVASTLAAIALGAIWQGRLAAARVSAGMARYAAEAGAVRAMTEIHPAADFSAELAEPGPFDASGPPPFRFHFEPGPEGALRALSRGFGPAGAEALVEAVFRRRQNFEPPGSLVVGPLDAFVASRGSVIVARGDSRRAAAAEEITSRDALAAALEQPVALVGPWGFAGAATVLATGADRSVAQPVADIDWGSVGSPEIVLVRPGASFAGYSSIVGAVVVAESPLVVEGDLLVTGLLLASQGLEISGSLAVRGAAWAAGRIDVRGRLDVLGDVGATARVDQARSGVLPRPADIRGWREVD